MRKEEILYSSLPLTYQHAVDFTRAMAVDFLWLDSLCILQDSKEDWERESMKMGQIYCQSKFTIGANLADNAHGGLFSDDGTDFNWQISTLLPEGQRSNLVLTNGRAIPSSTPLSKRAWASQEEMMSPRMIDCTNCGLFWKCQREQHNIEGPSQFAKETSANTWFAEHGRASHLWYSRIIPEYSKRAITFASDRLLAISAIAKQLAQGCKMQYVVGLWYEELALGLIWQRNGEDFHEPGHQKGPAWTWASHNFQVTWDVRADRSHPILATGRGFDSSEILSSTQIQILDSRIMLSGTDPFGTVSEGQLTVRGKVRRISLYSRGAGGIGPLPPPGYRGSLLAPNLDYPSQWEGLRVAKDVFMLQILTSEFEDERLGSTIQYFLLLQPVEGNEEHYTRIGVQKVERSGWYGAEQSMGKWHNTFEERTLVLE